MSSAKEHKILVTFGPREEEILKRMDENNIIPSRNEVCRRGIFAVDRLLTVREGVALYLLADHLSLIRKFIDKGPETEQYDLFLSELVVTDSLARLIRAVFAAKKGVLETELVETISASMLNYLNLFKDRQNYERVDRSELAEEIAGLQAFTKLMISEYVPQDQRWLKPASEMKQRVLGVLSSKPGLYVSSKDIALEVGATPELVRNVLFNLKWADVMNENLNYDPMRDAFASERTGKRAIYA